MAVTNTKTTSVSSSLGTVTVSGSNVETGSNEQSLDESFSASTVDQQITVAFQLSTLQSIYLISSVDLTFKTNGISTADVQTISISGTPAGGTFTLAFDGEPAKALAYNSAASDIQAALQALSNIGSGNVTATGGPLPGTPIVCTFTGDLDTGFQPLMLSNSDGLTGGSSPTVSVAHTTPGLPSNTITLTAGAPYSWGVSEGRPLILTEDVTTAYVSCTLAARLQGRILNS